MVISRKSLTILGLALSAAWFVGCSSKKPSKGGISSGETEAAIESGDGTLGTPEPVQDEDPAKKPNNQVAALSSAYGILNFRQVTATLSNMTGVALNSPAATGGTTPLAEYTKALSALPTDYAPAAISAGKVASVTKLAAAYCDVLANTPALLTAKFPGLSLAAAPADSAAFAKTLVDGFYGPETALQGPRAADIEIVKATVDTFKSYTGVPAATAGQAIFMATCAGIAASGEFFLY